MTRMLRRLLPLVIAVLVGAAPTAREICEVSCAGHSASAAAPHAHHAHVMAAHHVSDHAMSAPDTEDASPSAHAHCGATSSCESSVTAGRHACGHGDDSQADATPATTLLTRSPAIVAQVQGVARPDHEKAPFSDGTDHPFVPIPISLRTPLRV